MAEISFGEWLKRRRGTKGWTQKQLAHYLNCSISTIRKLEAEERRPSVQVVERLAEIFELAQDEHKSFLRFSRGDWQAGPSQANNDAPWYGFKAPRSNLPIALTSFIGRKKETGEIINLLSKNRLVTLAGAGGIGKTRLSLQVGEKFVTDYSVDTWFIPLDSLSDPDLVPQTVASVFGIQEGSYHQPLLERLTHVLRQKTALLILDNCEHLLGASVQLIQALLINCPSLKILATSRELLNLEGEAVYYLSSLSIPGDDISLETVAGYESIQLFVERASLALISFQLTKENARPIFEICRRVDGIPLAIELAAAHVDILQATEILHQLNQSFSLPASGSRSVLPRHQTMKASLDWSWKLLTVEEQVFLRQLSVFAGGWTFESAQSVCEGNILKLMSTLVRKSLILANLRSEGGTRYHFHEIVRQYMFEKLIDSGQESAVRTGHLKYFLRFSEQAEPALKGPEQIEWMAKLNDERDNIRVALTWAEETDVEAGLYMSSRFGRFWENFDMHEGSYWLSTFLQKPEAQIYPKARAVALYAHLPILNYLNEIDVWQATANECLELCRAFGDQYVEMEILLMKPEEITDGSQRIELLQRAQKSAQASGDIWRQARTLHQAGWNNSGDERIAYWNRAIDLFRQAGDWRSLAQCLSTAAYFALLNCELEMAQKLSDEAIVLNYQLIDKGTKADLLHVQARIASLQGRYNQSRIYLMEELAITEELGARMSSLWCRAHLGYVALNEGNLTEAREIFTGTTREFLNDKNQVGVVFSLEGVAGLYSAVGKLEVAARLIGWTDAIREKSKDTRPRLEQADVDKIIAGCVAEMGEASFSDAYQEGKMMPLDEAVAYGLNAG